MGFNAYLSGKPLQEPTAAMEAVFTSGRPGHKNLSKANSFSCPAGQACGRGWVLMMRDDLADLDLNALHELTFQYTPEKQTALQEVSLQNLVICREPQALTFGISDALDNCVYLVELSDIRWLLDNPYYCVPINKQYNVRAPAHGADTGANIYYADSLNAGSAWTWQTMVSNIWNLMTRLGTLNTLPFTPDGTPEGWVFTGMPAWKALNQVLDRIGCIIKVDLESGADQFSIARIGSADATADAILAVAESSNRLIHDSSFLSVVRGIQPEKVRVFFNRREKFSGSEQTAIRTSEQWQTISVYSVDVAGTGTGFETGTFAVVWDDLPAIYDADGTLTNSAALSTRATERAADYYRMLTTGGARLWKIYDGLLNITPGSTIKGVTWRAFSRSGSGVMDGIATEIVRHPFLNLRVDDYGEWECCETSVSTQPPDFGPTWPIYPMLPEVAEIATAAPSSGRYDALLQKTSTSGEGFVDKQSIYLVEMNGDTSTLIVGSRYPCRLWGFANGRPIYVFRNTGGTSGTSTIQTVALTGDTSVTPTSGQINITANASGYVVSLLDPGFTVPTGSTTAVIITNTDTTDSFIIGTSNFVNLLNPITVPPGATVTTHWDEPSGQYYFDGISTASSPTSTEYTGTTTNAFATVFDYTNTNGVMGSLSIKNTGVTNGLNYKITVKDMYGTSQTSTTSPLGPLGLFSWTVGNTLGGVTIGPPFQEVKVEVQDQVAGNHTTYDIWWNTGG